MQLLIDEAQKINKIPHCLLDMMHCAAVGNQAVWVERALVNGNGGASGVFQIIVIHGEDGSMRSQPQQG